jgi:hypothetical protein
MLDHDFIRNVHLGEVHPVDFRVWSIQVKTRDPRARLSKQRGGSKSDTLSRTGYDGDLASQVD